jgi:hypothetical protein
MSVIKIFLFGLLLCALCIAGCSSNTSSSSGFGSGSGYSINLTATQTLLRQGGGTTLIALVKDSQGNPVNDSTTGVSFTSSLGATIAVVTSINGGVCSTTYTAPGASSSSTTTTTTTTTTGVDQVTASYKGAFAYQSIYVFAP